MSAMEWVYISPDKLREAIAYHELEIASLRMTLESVERGQTVITGTSPVDSSTGYFTCAVPKETPFD
jgi:hypothetical protein